jgi:hypothetical protein
MVGRRNPQGVRAWFSRPPFSGFDVPATGRGGHLFPDHVPKCRIFCAISPLPKHFSGIFSGVPVIRSGGAAAKYRADHDRGPAWRVAFFRMAT